VYYEHLRELGHAMWSNGLLRQVVINRVDQAISYSDHIIIIIIIILSSIIMCLGV
jgi:hypothetical protein